MKIPVQRRHYAKYRKWGVHPSEMFIVLTMFDMKYQAIKEIKNEYGVGTTEATKILERIKQKKQTGR